jgi:hypothetical protein
LSEERKFKLRIQTLFQIHQLTSFWTLVAGTMEYCPRIYDATLDVDWYHNLAIFHRRVQLLNVCYV